MLITERGRETLDKTASDKREPDEQTTARYGDVAPQLNRVLHYANFRWGTNISHQDLARAVGCDARTIELFAEGDIKRYDLRTTAKLRWYFECRLVDLLQRIPPARLAACAAALGDPSLGRKLPPGEAPPETLVIATRIPDLLAAYSEQELAAAIPLHRKAVQTLRKRQTARIGRATLAAICTFLSEKEGREVGVADLLIDPSPLA